MCFTGVKDVHLASKNVLSTSRGGMGKLSISSPFYFIPYLISLLFSTPLFLSPLLNIFPMPMPILAPVPPRPVFFLYFWKTSLPPINNYYPESVYTYIYVFQLCIYIPVYMYTYVCIYVSISYEWYMYIWPTAKRVREESKKEREMVASHNPWVRLIYFHALASSSLRRDLERWLTKLNPGLLEQRAREIWIKAEARL